MTKQHAFLYIFPSLKNWNRDSIVASRFHTSFHCGVMVCLTKKAQMRWLALRLTWVSSVFTPSKGILSLSKDFYVHVMQRVLSTGSLSFFLSPLSLSSPISFFLSPLLTLISHLFLSLSSLTLISHPADEWWLKTTGRRRPGMSNSLTQIRCSEQLTMNPRLEILNNTTELIENAQPMVSQLENIYWIERSAIQWGQVASMHIAATNRRDQGASLEKSSLRENRKGGAVGLAVTTQGLIKTTYSLFSMPPQWVRWHSRSCP